MFFHVWENIRPSIKSYRGVWVSRQNSRLLRQNGHFRQNHSFLFVHSEKKLNITYDSWITSYPYPHNFYQAFFNANVLRFLCYFAACSGICWHFRILELVFVLEISLVRCAHSFDFWYVNKARAQIPFARTFHEVFHIYRILSNGWKLYVMTRVMVK